MGRKALWGMAVLVSMAAYPAAAVYAGKVTGSSASFSRPIPKDDRIPQALNRLTFGPRPGDAAQVKAMGLKKWNTSCELPICPFAIAKKKEHRRPTQGVFGARRFGIPYATRGDLRNPVCEPYRQ